MHGFNRRMKNIWKKKFHEIPKNTTWICHSSSTIYIALTLYLGFPGGSDSKESACNAGDMVWSMDWEDPLEKEMATHSSILAWRIPWTEEPGGLQSMGSQRVRHDWATNIILYRPLSLFTFLHWRRKWQPTPVFLPGESQGRELPSTGSHRVQHDWSTLAAAAA